MALYKITNKKLAQIKEKKIDLEKDIQQLTEDNLDVIFGYKFVCSEFRIDTFRFDTLAWDDENKAFIIIEYKKDRNFSIVDQGFAYLSLLLNRKADFILEYNTKFPSKQLKKEDIDWSQSRIVFVAPSFTAYQINSINFKDMAFDLYEVKVYDNDTVAYNHIEASNPAESIDLVAKKSSTIEKVTSEVKSYTIEDQIKPNWTFTREIFDVLDERLLALDPNLTRSPQKYYIGYKIDNSVLLAIKGFKSGPVLQFNRFQPSDFKDPESKVNYEKNSYKYYNKHVSWIQLKSIDDIDYAIMLAKQVYKKFVDGNSVG